MLVLLVSAFKFLLPFSLLEMLLSIRRIALINKKKWEIEVSGGFVRNDPKTPVFWVALVDIHLFTYFVCFLCFLHQRYKKIPIYHVLSCGETIWIDFFLQKSWKSS